MLADQAAVQPYHSVVCHSVHAQKQALAPVKGRHSDLALVKYPSAMVAVLPLIFLIIVGSGNRDVLRIF